MNLNEYLEQYNKIFSQINLDTINNIIDYLYKFNRKSKIYVIGNGGSYALAEHFAQDLLKKCFLPTVALTNVSNLTAFSNDYEYYKSFEGQLETYINKGDCLICFSCSGNSDNINNACVTAKWLGATLISFTGFSEKNRVSSQSDFNVYIPSDDYGIIESIHSIIFHYIVDKLYEKLSLE